MFAWLNLEQEYGIRIVRQVSVRDVFKIYTRDHGVLCLKGYNISESEMGFIAQVFTHLARHEFVHCPRLLLTTSQAPWITKDGVHYMLTNWVIGEHPQFKNKEHLKKGIRLLARFHTVAQGLTAPQILERVRYNSLPALITSYRSDLDKYRSMRYMVALCDQALEQLQHSSVIKAIANEQAAAAFVHGDYNYPNLVIDTSKSMHLIDFDNTSLNVRMQDFSHILHRNLPWKGQQTLRYIEYYDSKRALSKEDLHLLYTLLLVPYPIIRAIRRKKLIKHAQIASLPTSKQIKDYKVQLKQLI
ncbi:CotS family spore coat protein [Paenibacillus sp. DS2015]|uniref:phosphotransferase n=1 Tax=Paenibacillus sp. DS2015 TaxID=3373917 RepID=UPI003D19830F